MGSDVNLITETELRRLNREVPLQFVYSRQRFMLVVLSIFAGLGLALAAIGVYGVIAYSTERQTHEIGIRMTLGAVVAVLFITGLAATWIPAQRAARVDPAIALRYE